MPAIQVTFATCPSQRAVAQAVVQDIEERARRAKPPGLEQLCRYLLVADTYSVLVRACPAAALKPELSTHTRHPIRPCRQSAVPATSFACRRRAAYHIVPDCNGSLAVSTRC